MSSNVLLLPRHIEAVVIGGSSGAIQALDQLLPALPASMRVPVMIVVHVPPHRPSLLVELFEKKCRLPVREPLDKEKAERGIWFAPPDYHMLVEADHTFSLSLDPQVNFSRPSIDVLFESAAEAYGDRLAGVVLTGGNDDGARGLRAIREAGGFAMAQDPASAEAPVMPRTAIAAATPQIVGDIAKLAAVLTEITSEGPAT